MVVAGKADPLSPPTTPPPSSSISGRPFLRRKAPAMRLSSEAFHLASDGIGMTGPVISSGRAFPPPNSNLSANLAHKNGKFYCSHNHLRIRLFLGLPKSVVPDARAFSFSHPRGSTTDSYVHRSSLAFNAKRRQIRGRNLIILRDSYNIRDVRFVNTLCGTSTPAGRHGPAHPSTHGEDRLSPATVPTPRFGAVFSTLVSTG